MQKKWLTGLAVVLVIAALGLGAVAFQTFDQIDKNPHRNLLPMDEVALAFAAQAIGDNPELLSESKLTKIMDGSYRAANAFLRAKAADAFARNAAMLENYAGFDHADNDYDGWGFSNPLGYWDAKGEYRAYYHDDTAPLPTITPTPVE